MVVVGVILMAIAAVLLLIRQNYQRRSFSVKSARPVQTASLTATAQAVAVEIGGGDWRDYVRLWGKIRCDEPLISELKQVPCVYYRYTVQREYEETHRRQTSEGRWETTTQRGSEILSSHQQRVPFWLVDSSGTVEINPDGADIETVEIVNDFQPGEPQGPLAFGRYRRDPGALAQSRRTLGYRYREAVLPLGRSVLVVGEATDATGPVTLAKPDGRQYIISLKPYEMLARRTDANAQRAFWGAMGCAAIGGLLMLLGWRS
ncbi:E3 ubiquitin ligase [filamentous cyanobacterium CCP5]|nr:E3 ubiquitin ligase [filamentous cyanobacterium CCP5]